MFGGERYGAGRPDGGAGCAIDPSVGQCSRGIRRMAVADSGISSGAIVDT